MRFHRISPCPRCGGKVKAKWERDGVQWLPEYTFFIVMFRCTQDSDKWDVYISKSVYPTAESYGTLAGVLRMIANDVEIMAHETEMGGRR